MWQRSFVTRLGGSFALLMITVVMISGWVRDRADRMHALAEEQRRLAHLSELIRLRSQAAVDAVLKDVVHLSRAPALGRLAAASGEPQRLQALQEAAAHFRTLIEVRSAYFQVRLIGIADGGREVIRFDRAGERLFEVRGTDLQRKGDRDYFIEAARLRPGHFHLSAITLNQEFGRISDPPTPTLRVSMPVFDAMGSRFGMVVINVDVRPLFQELVSLASPAARLELCNLEGDYLMHPDSAKTFGFDLGRRYRIVEDHPEVRLDGRGVQVFDGAGEIAVSLAFPLIAGAEPRLYLRLGVAKGPLLAPLQVRSAVNLGITALLAGVAAAVVIGMTWLLAWRLRRLSDAVAKYRPGAEVPLLPPESADEVGVLSHAFREMAQKIREQVQGLQEARERAEQAAREREAFFSALSHEIRTPMNAVLGLAGQLEAESASGTQHDRLRTLKFAGRHLMALLNNFLDRDRIDAGAIALDPAPFDLNELLENLGRSLQPLAARRGLELDVLPLPAAHAWVRGDAVRLYQVLNNLAHNALMYTEHGGVTVAAEPRAVGQISFRVEDTGPGLPPAVQRALAEPSRPWPSGGLGLRISQRLVQALGGGLAADCSSRGTRLGFDLELPAATGDRAAPPHSAVPDLTGYTGLVVEDLPSNRLVLEALLERTRLALHFAATAAEARQALLAESFDLVFLDLQLPDGGGLDLIGEFRRLQPEARALVITAQVSAEIRAQCAAAGAHEFVSKPIAAADLFEKLRRLTAPDVRRLHAVFDGDSDRIDNYLAALGVECAGWEAELKAVLEASDLARLRRLRHRMRTGVEQLGLWKLEASMARVQDALARGEGAAVARFGAVALCLLASVRQLSGAKRLRTESR
jgi:signal transduction histidine kinase/CheY-like chemotaxis protein